MDTTMIQGGHPSVSERRAAQRWRIAERNAIVARREAEISRRRRAATDDDLEAAYGAVAIPVWEEFADGLAPHQTALLRWLLFGVAPIALFSGLWLLAARSWDIGRLEAAAILVDSAVLLLALFVGIALGREWFGRTSAAATHRFIYLTTVACAVIGVGTLAAGIFLTAPALDRAARNQDDAVLPFVCAVGPLLCLAAALVDYHVGAGRHRAMERLARRCGLDVHVGATALRRWLDRCWEGDVSSDQLERRRSSAYLLAGRIEGFDVGIEIRLENPRRASQIFVAAALDPATSGGLTEWLRASGFTADIGAAGVVASPWRIERRAIARGREEALGVLHDGVRGIVAFVVKSGVHPLQPIAE